MATKKVTKVQVPVDSHETFVSIRKSFDKADNVKERLEALYELQCIDSQLDKIYQERGELPQEVAALETKIEELQAKASAVSESIAESGRKISDFRQQAIQCKEQAAKYQARIDEGIENSREYDSLSKEIENQDLLAQVAQKRIGENEEFIAERKEALEGINAKIEVRKEDLAAKKAELDQIAVSTAKQEKELLEKRKAASECVDASTMSAYERIRKSVHNHIAVAAVYGGNACGGCHSKIPAQKLINIHAGKKMILCDYCRRILVEAPEQENQ